MNRLLLVLAAALLAAPMANAHDPPGPNPACDARQTRHDYIPALRPYELRVEDGNVTDCIEGSNDVRIDLDGLAPCVVGLPGLCYSVYTGLEQSLVDYDGDLEFGYGGAILFAGPESGVCYGGLAHHGDEIFAADALGFGPRFLVATDFSPVGRTPSPDCGDGYLEPCMDQSPPESTLPAPAGAAVDEVGLLVHLLFGPAGSACNAQERGLYVESTPVAPSGGKVPFGPGVDGAYVVFLTSDGDTGRTPTAGHIWS